MTISRSNDLKFLTANEETTQTSQFNVLFYSRIEKNHSLENKTRFDIYHHYSLPTTQIPLIPSRNQSYQTLLLESLLDGIQVR